MYDSPSYVGNLLPNVIVLLSRCTDRALIRNADPFAMCRSLLEVSVCCPAPSLFDATYPPNPTF